MHSKISTNLNDVCNRIAHSSHMPKGIRFEYDVDNTEDRLYVKFVGLSQSPFEGMVFCSGFISIDDLKQPSDVFASIIKVLQMHMEDVFNKSEQYKDNWKYSSNGDEFGFKSEIIRAYDTIRTLIPDYVKIPAVKLTNIDNEYNKWMNIYRKIEKEMKFKSNDFDTSTELQ